MQKRTVEGTPCMWIHSFKGRLNGRRMEAEIPGYPGQICIHSHGDYFLIDYQDGTEPQSVWIDYTAVGFGARPWFCCPECDKRTERLYLVDRIFRCRACHELTYLTCKVSGNRLDELALKIRRLQKRLGLDITAPFGSPDYVEIDDKPVYKPEHMKQATFDRLRRDLEIVQLQRIEEWLKHASKWP